MGIKGLESFLKPYETDVFGQPVPLRTLLAGKILLIDFPGLLFFLLDHSAPDGPSGLSSIIGTTPRILQLLTAFTRRLSGEGIKQVWLLDGGHNPGKYDTAMSRLAQRTPAACSFADRVLNACLFDPVAEVPYKCMQEFTMRALLPALALPKYNRNQITKYLLFRDALEGWGINGLIRQLIDEGSLLGYETTIFEGDARIARLVNIDHWNGQPIGAVLAQDSDFLIYGCSYVPFRKLRVSLVEPVNPDTPTVGGMCRKGVFAEKLRSIAIAHLASVFRIASNLNQQSFAHVKSHLDRVCRVDRIGSLLVDFAMLCGNDYYTTEDITTDIFLSHRHISTHILSLLGAYVSKKALQKCKLSIFSVSNEKGTANKQKYANFSAIGALLVVCVLCGFDASGDEGLDVTSEALQSVLFNKVGGIVGQVQKYDNARRMYGMESPLARNETPEALIRAPYGNLYKQLSITRHFAHLICGPKMWIDRTAEHRFDQFQLPAANISAQMRLIYEIGMLAAWASPEEISRVHSVQTGEFLRDPSTGGATSMSVVEWKVSTVKDPRTGYMRCTVNENIYVLLNPTVLSPSLRQNQPINEPDSTVAVSTAAIVLDPPGVQDVCGNGCTGRRRVDLNNQASRLSWLSERGVDLWAGSAVTRRCYLYQCLDAGNAAHTHQPNPLLDWVATLTPPEKLKQTLYSVQCVIDLIILTEICLVRAYGDHRGGLLASTCRLHTPFRSLHQGYVIGIVRAITQSSELKNISNSWFTIEWGNSGEMAAQCSILAVHTLFHTALEHVLMMNNILCGPLYFNDHAGDLFLLEDAMQEHVSSTCLPGTSGGLISAVADHIRAVVSMGVSKL